LDSSLPTTTIDAGMPTSTSTYGPIDGCDELTMRETKYSQPIGIPSQSRIEPIAMRTISTAATSLRPTAMAVNIPGQRVG
jgi:hypothetical protein